GGKPPNEPQTQALFPCIQNILLACRAVGLGASLTTAHRAHGREIDEYLGLSADTPSIALLPIGWPKGRYGRPPRRPVDQALFFNRVDGIDLARRERGALAPDLQHYERGVHTWKNSPKVMGSSKDRCGIPNAGSSSPMCLGVVSTAYLVTAKSPPCSNIAAALAECRCT